MHPYVQPRRSGESALESPRQPLPRPWLHSHAHPRGTMRTAAACSTSDRKPRVLQPTAHVCRSHSTCSAHRRPSRFLVRPRESRGPPREDRYGPSPGVEPPGAGPHSNCARIRPHCVRLGTHALSLHPPLRAQMSAARGVRGRAELALRRRCVGCPAGGAAPRAKGLSGRLAR